MAEDADNIAKLDEERRRRRGSGGAGGAADDKLVLNPRYPDMIAGRFLAAAYTDAAGRHTLAHHLGLFYRWEGTCWEPAEPDQLRAALYAWLRPAWRPTTKGDLEEFDASRNNILDILDALAGRVQARRASNPAGLARREAGGCRRWRRHRLPQRAAAHPVGKPASAHALAVQSECGRFRL
jgi:hypothetical protein